MKKLVKCPSCKNPFKTKKDVSIQCGKCGERFDLKGNEVKI